MHVLLFNTDLVDIIIVDGGVKHRVKVIEKIDDLEGSAEGGDRRETHDVGEIDGYDLERLCLDPLTG